jgi:hypothetical protein
MPMLRVIANYIHNNDEPDSQMIFDVLLNENQMISGDHEFYGCSAGEGSRFPFILQATDEEDEIEIYWGSCFNEDPTHTTINFHGQHIDIGVIFTRTDVEGRDVMVYEYRIVEIIVM